VLDLEPDQLVEPALLLLDLLVEALDLGPRGGPLASGLRARVRADREPQSGDGEQCETSTM
jgi:hypothetical protein